MLHVIPHATPTWPNSPRFPTLEQHNAAATGTDETATAAIAETGQAEEAAEEEVEVQVVTFRSHLDGWMIFVCCFYLGTFGADLEWGSY